MDSINFGVQAVFPQNEGEPHIIKATSNLDKRNHEVMFATHEFPADNQDDTRSHILEFELDRWSQMDQILELVERHIEHGTDLNRKLTLDVSNICIRRIEGDEDMVTEKPEDVSEITFALHQNSLELSGIDDLMLFMPYCGQFSYQGPPDSISHLMKFRDALKEILVEFESSIAPIELRDVELSSRCAPRFERGNYVDAITNAHKVLEQRVKRTGGSELSQLRGRDLMMQAFSKNGGELSYGEEDAEREGVMFLYAGMMQAFRNPLAHRDPDPDGSKHLDGLDEQDTRSILYFVDYLLSRI